MPEISIIVPVYKVEPYIHRCIDSILAQTFTDFELILVDDGSPDNCGTICDEYAAKDDRIIVIHKENGGVSSARNTGLDIASGRYIMFCDSDDWTELFWLETLYKEAETHPDMCIVANMWSVTGEEEICRAIGKTTTSKTTNTYYEIWKNGVSPYTPNKIYWKDIIDSNRLRFDPTIKLSEDLAFNLNYHSVIEQMHKNHNDIYIYIYQHRSTFIA